MHALPVSTANIATAVGVAVYALGRVHQRRMAVAPHPVQAKSPFGLTMRSVAPFRFMLMASTLANWNHISIAGRRVVGNQEPSRCQELLDHTLFLRRTEVVVRGRGQYCFLLLDVQRWHCRIE